MNKVFKNLTTNIKREKMLSITNILVMTFTFLLFGVLIFVVVASQTALRYLEQQVQVSAFFKDDFSEANILALKTKYEEDKRISSVKYVSKDAAFKIFSEINKDEPILLESISPSILPASLELKTVNIGDLSGLADEISKTDGVEEVRFFKDVVDRFKFWSGVAYIVGFVLVGVFLFISYTVIIAAMRSTIHAKGRELEIMKLVGATDKYIKTPLLLQGLFYGITSALLASVFMLLCGAFLNRSVLFNKGLSFGFMPTLFVRPLLFSAVLSVVMLFSGIVMGYFASLAAIKKYLKY